MNLSPIEWTDYTSNPLRYRDPDGNIVHACIHKSGGCLHCYAEVMSKRWGRKGLPFTAENMKPLTPFLDEKELHHMLTYKPAAGKRCFVGDMTDIFGEWVPDELLWELFSVFALRSDVTWQVLTKRADRMMRLLLDNEWESKEGGVPFWAMVEGCAQRRYHDRTGEDPSLWLAVHGPLPNVWLGVSAEDQKNADERIPLLLQTPAAVRFVSYEPALGPVEFDCGPGRSGPHRYFSVEVDHPEDQRLDWVIVGGESGPGARPFNIQWARVVVAQCQAAGVAVFYKQGGASNKCAHDSKGGHFECLPSDLKIREFPHAAR